MSEDSLAREIIELVGGQSNIQSLTHCVTRLRFNLKDDSKADDKKIESLENIMGVQQRGGQYQIIIGPKVSRVYKSIIKEIPILSENNSKISNKKKESLVN